MSNTTGHTPGPWKAHYNERSGIQSDGQDASAEWWWIEGPNINIDCMAGFGAEIEANARLIADAPRLKAENEHLRAQRDALLAAAERISDTRITKDRGAFDSLAECHKIARSAIAQAKEGGTA